nr:MAG TPA: hypothetical protein [Caudoviricetes sp.]
MRKSLMRRVSTPLRVRTHIRSASTNFARLWVSGYAIRPRISPPMTLRWKSALRHTASL